VISGEAAVGEAAVMEGGVARDVHEQAASSLPRSLADCPGAVLDGG